MSRERQRREVARAGAEYHQAFCTHLPPDQQQRVFEVIEDLIYTSIIAYEAAVLDARRQFMFSVN